jgi:bifunctional non-homologous end joining protein LigD
MAKAQEKVLEAAGREVVITSPDKVFFPQTGFTKLDLANYYLAVAHGALRGIGARPVVLKRYVNGAGQEPFFQKRAPENRLEWIETVVLSYPSGRSADEVVVRDAAQLLWIVNLGCIDLNPHPVRADDLDHPDELRVDLDPGPSSSWDDVRRVALAVRDVLEEHGLQGWPKTSGSRGMHVNVRIQRRWSFDQVRRAALALAREAERRLPDLATSRWWKEERHGVFVDYNQNARDRTVASAWSVRPTPDARVSMPLAWDEVADCDPAAFTLLTAPARFAESGDPSAGIDEAAGSLESLLELSATQKAADGREKSRQRDRSRKDGPSSSPGGTQAPQPGRRLSTQPLITVAKAQHKDEALAGLERWKARHPAAAALLQVDDILVDSMRGRYTTWTRIRLNLHHVPEAARPAEEQPDPDYDPWRGLSPQARPTRSPRSTYS